MTVPFKALALGALAALAAPLPARAYDMDCAVILCMVGGFPRHPVCSAAFAYMIRRITPWPVLPPFGICSFAAVPIALGGPGGQSDLDVSGAEYDWLRRTRVLWFQGRHYEPQDEPIQWDWIVRSCDSQNQNCSTRAQVFGSLTPWPATILSDSGQQIPLPPSDIPLRTFIRATALEYGDYQGAMAHSEWFRY